jgi:hypothetical protein
MPKQKTSKLAISSLIISIIAGLTQLFNIYLYLRDKPIGWNKVGTFLGTMLVSLPASIIAIIVAVISLAIIKKKMLKGKNYAITSLVISLATAAISLVIYFSM